MLYFLLMALPSFLVVVTELVSCVIFLQEEVYSRFVHFLHPSLIFRKLQALIEFVDVASNDVRLFMSAQTAQGKEKPDGLHVSVSVQVSSFM